MKKTQDFKYEDEIQKHLEEIDKVPDVSAAFEARVLKNTAHINAMLTKNIIEYNRIASRQTKHIIFLNWTIAILTLAVVILTFILAAK